MSEQKIAIGIDIGGTNIKSALVNNNGIILCHYTSKTKGERGRQTILNSIFECINNILKDQNIKIDKIEGIGIGTPGYVENGIIKGAINIPKWNNTNLFKEINSKYNTNIFATNDVNLAVFGEFKHGAGKGSVNMICYAIGTGIGGGIIINKELYEGTSGMAGEFGHMPVVYNGRSCGCGKKGCVEAYSSSIGIKSIAKEMLLSNEGKKSLLYEKLNGNIEKVTPKDVYDCLKENDAVCNKINQVVCKYLAMALGGSINIFNPDTVVLGGGVMAAGNLILDPLKENLKIHTLPWILEKCKIFPAKLGEKAGVIGCAAFVFHNKNKIIPK